MSIKKILIVGTSEAADAVAERLRGSGWEAHRAADAGAAQAVRAEHGCTVGLLLVSGDDEASCADLDAFLATSGDLEWVGCFEAAAVARPAWRELILSRLFDHHTLPFDWPRLSTAWVTRTAGRRCAPSPTRPCSRRATR